MAEAPAPLGALAHLDRAGAAWDGAGAALAELPLAAKVNLRGPAADATFAEGIRRVLGLALPGPNGAAVQGGRTVLGLGPDEWLIVGASGEEAALNEALRQALGAVPAAVTDVTHARAVFRLSGPRARDVLASGTTIDLHPRAFAPGRTAQTTLALADVILHQVAGDEAAGGPAFEVHVARSFADYLWRWLVDAARAEGA